jgi:ribonuclease HII
MRFDRDLIPQRPDFRYEIGLWSAACERVAGGDEAGRGAMAGPVTAAIVVFPPDPNLAEQLWGVNDSKLMRPAERVEWAVKIKEICMYSGVGFASAVEIDMTGILAATRQALLRAIESLPVAPQHLLLDYISLPDCQVPQNSLVKGDRRSLSIAAASILAKTARDDFMRDLDHQFPGYGFAIHKGYGTAAHRAIVEKSGLSSEHRFSFKWHLKPISPVKD